jgi:hypothetical protein
MSGRRKPRFDESTTLAAWWSEKERDLMFHHPTRKADGHMLMGAFCYPPRTPGIGLMDREEPKSLVQELEARGFDLTTLRFTIQLKRASPGAGGADAKEAKP